MNKPLQGKRILVTRPVAQAEKLAVLISDAGGEAVCFPLLVITPMENRQPLESAIAGLTGYHMIVFVSPNAVEFSVPYILQRRSWPEGLQAVAVGGGTAARLADYGIRGVLVPEHNFDSEALLALYPLQREAVAGKRVLIVRGDSGRELLADTLRKRGAQVVHAACYCRRAPMDGAALVALLCNNELDAITLSSSEGGRNLLGLLDEPSRERLLMLPVFVPHARIAAEAKRLGLHRVVQTGPADVGLVDSLCNYDWSDHE